MEQSATRNEDESLTLGQFSTRLKTEM